MAACIAAGLHGIEKGLKLTAPPINGTNQGAENIPRAPRTLIETTRIFRESDVARDWFGDEFVDHFAATREWEWRQWQDARDRLGTEALLRDHLMTRRSFVRAPARAALLVRLAARRAAPRRHAAHRQRLRPADDGPARARAALPHRASYRRSTTRWSTATSSSASSRRWRCRGRRSDRRTWRFKLRPGVTLPRRHAVHRRRRGVLDRARAGADLAARVPAARASPARGRSTS